MSPWLIHSLISVTVMGAMMALYKVPTTKGHSKFTFSFLSFFVATILSFFTFYSYIEINYYAILFGCLWGIGFAIVSMLQMELLKKLDTNSVFPLTSLSSHIIVVTIGLLFFHDKISAIQFFGILLTFIIIGFYNKSNKHVTIQNKVLPMILGLALLSAITKFVQKFGSITVEIHNFIFWQMFFAMIASFIILLIVKRKELHTKIKLSKNILLWSILLGILNFVGTVEIVKALSTGPFSLVYTINSFYILITSIVAWKFFDEKLTKRKIIFLLISIVTVILISIG